MRNLVLFVSFLTSCNGVKQGPSYTLVDYTELTDLISKFPIKDDSLIVEFDDSSYAIENQSGNGVQGQCIIELNHIILDEKFWVESERVVKETLLYHEMAHCLLGIGHHENTIMDSFIGQSVANYKLFALKDLYELPCTYACNSDRIKTNRKELFE